MSNNLMGIYTIWLRDLRRFRRDKSRIIGAIVQPALFLIFLGTGLSRALQLRSRVVITPAILSLYTLVL